MEYVNVLASDENMDRMLKASKGDRRVPIIVEGGVMVAGFGGT